MMTGLGTAAVPAERRTIGGLEFEILALDPDVAALIAEVDAILCAALTPARRPPAPPTTGCALVEPRPAGRTWGALVRPRPGPVQPVRAVQRGPPSREQLATKVNNPT